jgi:predicted acylesterase/phospholipase RssA
MVASAHIVAPQEQSRRQGRTIKLDWSASATLVICLVCLSVLEGCAGFAAIQFRSSVARPSPTALPMTVRMLEPDHRLSQLSFTSVADRLRALHRGEPLNILALSGGGAAGAFGAGAVAGLTRAGSRPEFAVVTGVSAGALIAPYAFLGPTWDARLLDAFTGRATADLLQARVLSAIFGFSLYRGAPLQRLVDSYATEEMVQAVAREADKGRLLLVATTDIATGKLVVWDLGSIARNGGLAARTLFRDVLVASASVPGIFPPGTIRVRDDDQPRDEQHIDAAATVPFFVPSALAQTLPGSMNGPDRTAVYVIIDRPLSEPSRATRMTTQPIESQNILAGLNHSLITTLELTAMATQSQGATLRYAAVSGQYPHVNPLDFHAGTMQPLFRYAYQCAEAGRLWTAFQGTDARSGTEGFMTEVRKVPCPADDAVIGHVASHSVMSLVAR